MKNPEKRDRIVAGTATALFVASLIGVIYLNDSNKSLKDLLNSSKLSNETLLSEKLALNKISDKQEKEIADKNKKNKELDQMLANANSRIASLEKEIANGNPNHPKVRALNKQLADLKILKTALEGQIAVLNDDINRLSNANNELSGKLASMEAKYKSTSDDLNLMKAFAANNYRASATQGKRDKLTVKAARTKKLSMGFDIPQHVAENVQFRITTPEGKVINHGDEALSSVLVEDGSDLVASIDSEGNFDVSRRIEMTYRPKEKLKKGVYTIDLYNGSTYMVSCQLALR